MAITSSFHYWMMLLVAILPLSSGSSESNISVYPIASSVDRGGKVYFSCIYPGNVTITWSGPGVEVGTITKNVTKMSRTNSTLTIADVMGSHAGMYFCTAHVSEGGVTMINSTAVNLTVNYMMVKLTSSVFMVHKSPHVTVSLYVVVFGSLSRSVNMKLSHGGSNTNRSIPQKPDSQIHHLEIPDSVADQLNCTRSVNDLMLVPDDPLIEFKGSTKFSIYIVPTIGFEMTAYHVMEGDSVKVCANVLCGILLQDVVVTLSIENGTAIADENFVASLAKEKDITLNSSLSRDCVMISTIFDPILSMEKQFQVLLALPVSAKSHSIILMPNVTTVTITDLALPMIIPSMIEVSTGQSSVFQVNVTFRGQAFQWQHNELNITDGDTYVGATMRNLTIMNISKVEEGSYSCIVVTEFGLPITSQQAQLKVFALPKITNEPMNITTSRDDTVYFNVTAISGEEFVYRWQRDGSDLIETRDKLEGVNSSVLTIRGVRNDDEGDYRCTICNSAGDCVKSDRAYLLVIDLPAIPVLTNVSTGSTYITFTWDQASPGDVLWYELQYNFTIRECEGNIGESSYMIMINGSSRSYTLKDSSQTLVEEDSIYTISLIAVNTDGRGKATFSEISTQGSVPTGAPKNLRSSSIDDRTIAIQWEPVECIHRNGEIIGYNLTYHPAREMWKSMTTFTSEMSFTGRGLLHNTSYEFEVQVVNKYGPGPPARIALQTSHLQGIMIVYGDQSYQNNGINIVNLNETGGMLHCYTNKTGCCRPQYGGEGEWIFPNGSTVQIRGNNSDFYRTRGNSPGVVSIVWTRNATIPKGVFCCVIPSSQIACIGVYTDEDEGIARVADITVDLDTNELICTSTGGPATTVIWKVNDQPLITDGTSYRQTQRIVSKENATFENILRIPSDNITIYNATYECTVLNSKGTDSMNISLEAIQIIQRNMSVGDDGSLVCKSIITVDVIEWLNSDGEVIASETGADELTLTFAPVNVSINNKKYTCRVNKSASLNGTVVVLVNVTTSLLVNIIGPSTTPSIGQRVNISCIAITAPRVLQLPTLTLTHPNGTSLASIEGKSLSIMLDPADIEDAGEYTCTGVINLENVTSVMVQARQNFTFRLPHPKISITYKGSLSVGSHLLVNCTLKNYSVIDLDVSINFTWLRSGKVLSNDTDRVVLFNFKESPSTFTSQLSLSPLSAHDANITCLVTAHPATPTSFIDKSPTVDAHVQLSIEDPDVQVEIVSEPIMGGHNLTAGTNFSLICAITVTDQTNIRPDLELNFEWMHFNGTVTVTAETNSSAFHFHSLKLSEAGEYMCQVSIASILLTSDLIIMSMKPYTIRVISPQPTVTAILSSQTVFAGSSLNITCIVEFDDNVDIPLGLDHDIKLSINNYLIDSDYPLHVDYYNQYEKTFTIRDIQHSQEYICAFQPTYLTLFNMFVIPSMDSLYFYVNVSINASLSIEVTPTGKSTAGEEYNLTCIVMVRGSSDVPDISWNSTVPSEMIIYDNGTYLSILRFDKLKEFHQTHYQCLVTIADIVEERLFNLIVQVPPVYATVYDSEDSPVTGQTYILTCVVTGGEKLDPSVFYQWTKTNHDGMVVTLENSLRNLTFSSLSLSDSGNYSCKVNISSRYLNQAISTSSNLHGITLQVPTPTVLLIPPLDIVFAGHAFSMTCMVDLPSTVDTPVTVDVVWNEPLGTRMNSTPTVTADKQNKYIIIATFVSDMRSDTINFQCKASVSSNSSFVEASEHRSTNSSVFVAGSPSKPTGLNASAGATTVNITWSTPSASIVYDYELQYNYSIRECLNNSPKMMKSIPISNRTSRHTLENLEEDSDFFISLIAMNPAGSSEAAVLTASTLVSAPSGAPQDLRRSVGYTNVTLEWNPVECSERNGMIDGYRLIYYDTEEMGNHETIQINVSNAMNFTIVGLQPRTNYTIALRALGRNYSLYGIKDQISVLTSAPKAIGFLFHGKFYANNSIVPIAQISEGKNSLLCITNISQCCTNDLNTSQTKREWYFPNGSVVMVKGAKRNFYRDRHLSVVRLNRRNNATYPTGIFRCEIPGSNPLSNVIYVGIYHLQQGIPIITSFNRSRRNSFLNCISKGGPVRTVSWMKSSQPLLIDGIVYQQTQMILDSENAVYRNTLHSDNPSKLVGVFTCTVKNARGSDSKTISTNGVVIENGSEVYTVGSNANITCQSATLATKIEWLTDEGILLAFVSMTNELDLQFTPVNDSVHGNVYTCKVTRNSTDVAEQNFTMNVRVPAADTTLEMKIDPDMSAYTAGKNYSFVCNANKRIRGLRYSPLVVWVVNGTEITEQSVNRSTITFNKLNTSHGNVYSCQGNLSSPALPTALILNKNHSVIIKIPRPRVNITLTSGGTIYAGTNLSIACDILISTAVDTDIFINVTWQNGTSTISNLTERVFISSISGTKPLFTSTLLIHPLIDVDNAQNFTCEASVQSNSSFVTSSSAGEGSIHIPVMQRAPSMPNVVIKNITTTGIGLTWSQQVQDFIKGFNVTITYTGPCNDFQNVTHNVLHPSIRQAYIVGLQEYSTYSIVITPFNDGGYSSFQISITTNNSMPDGSPNDIRTTSINLTSVTISWNPISCIKRNSMIHEYTVHYRKSFSSGERTRHNITTTARAATISNLDPRTKYEFEVQGINENGQTGPSTKLNVTTSSPTAVGFLFHDHHFANKSVVSLNAIGEGDDALVCLTNSFRCCEGTDQMTTGGWYFPNSNEVPLGSQGHDVYTTRGPSFVRLHKKRDFVMPSGLFHCKIVDANGTNQSIYIGIYQDNQGAGAVVVESLKFDKRRQALSCTSTGGPPTTVKWSKNGRPLQIDTTTYTRTQVITNTSSSTFVTTVFIHPRTDLSEIVGNYTCMVSNSRVNRNSMNVHTFEIQGLRVMGHKSSPIRGPSVRLNCTTDIAADTMEWLDVKGRVLVTGNGSLLQLIHAPIDSNNVEFTCRINSTFGSQNKTVHVHILLEEELSTSSIVIPIIVIISALCIVVLLIILVVIIMRRKQQGKLNVFERRKCHSGIVAHSTTLHKRSENAKTEEIEMNFYQKYEGAAVPLDDFSEYTKHMHDDRDKLFEDEYCSISKRPQKCYDTAEIPVNRMRNRFGNIFPYDHCRVKLKELVGVECSDYINASYLNGYQKPNAYIAAQGPLPNTLEDFWRMIWEKRLTTIVMLTQCFEGKKKCECYWPESLTDTLEFEHGLEVILTSVVPFSEYTVRKMTVTRTIEPEVAPLEVIQFHFIAWPDHGVPDNCSVMLNFIRRVRKLHPYSNPCPLLVHCSAGVGRTGTFIVLDSMLERMKVEDTLNICDFVKQLREQRVLMVQTLSQYIFIHDALKEHILCGQTEITASEIRKVMDKLSKQHDPHSAFTGFKHQFQILGQLKYESEDDYNSDATSKENIPKNRYSDKLPNNFYRVRLKPVASLGPDYINASFIDGYRQKNTYIATQGPLESTVRDFWQMVWERESKCVVLLSKLREDDKEMCCCYWPTTEGDTKMYGHILVKLLTEERYEDCDVRYFEINKVKVKAEGINTAFTVTQFHFLKWPEHVTPPITSSLIELVGNVDRVQMGADSKPMIVMCNDGVGRTGTFICIHAQLERLKTEGVFDIFQFIKSARMQRPGLVSDCVHYVLCHEVLADYLESFDAYANFKEVM